MAKEDVPVRGRQGPSSGNREYSLMPPEHLLVGSEMLQAREPGSLWPMRSDHGHKGSRSLLIDVACKPFPPPFFLCAHRKVSMLAVGGIDEENVKIVLRNYPSGILGDKRVGSMVSTPFGGEQEYLLQWIELFLEAMLNIIEKGHIARKDQNIVSNIPLNIVVLLKFGMERLDLVMRGHFAWLLYLHG
eukprot:scaffold425_cov365-Pavlova_lutheri.AAC.11